MTAEELKELYDKGAKIVIVENIEDHEVINEVKTQLPEYDLIIPLSFAVGEFARLIDAEYKEKHGYLPEETGITPNSITKEELKEMIEEGKVKIEDAPTATDFEPPGDPNVPPYEINGKIYVDVYPALDDAHAPSSGWMSAVISAIIPFEDEFGVDMIAIWYTNVWDASDVGDNIYNLCDDLKEDLPNPATNHVRQGWVDNSNNHNGVADKVGGHYSVCVQVPGFGYANWPDDSIAQHEISHNFDAQDGHKSGGQCTDSCIMDYWDAFWGTDEWCSYHWDIVNAGVWGP